MKDNFSKVAKAYSTYRPHYPVEIFDFIYSRLSNYENAWDCGTGNGQVAVKLSEQFSNVIATDISEQQIIHATKRAQIVYKLVSSEKADFPDSYFDLITVAQAIHWFDFDPFYENVKRSLRPDGLFAVLGYGLVKTNAKCDLIIQHLYKDILGDYWDQERRYIDENYQTIPFPFKEIETPAFHHEVSWTFDQFINYLETWSAVQHYKKQNNRNPLDLIKNSLQQIWEERKTVSFPILCRLGIKI